MANYSIVVCDTVSPNQLRTTTCPSGQYGHLVNVSLPDQFSVYGLPNISASDVATISIGIAGVWAIAWIIKRLMVVF